MKGEWRHQLPHTNSLESQDTQSKTAFTEGHEIGKNHSWFIMQTLCKKLFSRTQVSQNLPTRARSNSAADCNLKIRTTLIIHEGGKKSKPCSKQAEFPYNSLFVPSILATYTATKHRLALRKAAIRNVSSGALFPSSDQSHRSYKNFPVC